MIDEKTLSILGAPKEGFEWVEKSWPGGYVHSGDVALDVAGARWVNDGGDAPLMRGVAYGSGRYYRQVPIEPEPEVIWRHAMGRVAFEVRPDGLWQAEFPVNAMQKVRPGSSIHNLAEFAISQHKELKALKEKLGEIKKKAEQCESPEYYRANAFEVAARLVEAARAIEVPE